MLTIKEKPGCITVDAMRQAFEAAIRATPALASNSSLACMEMNGKFSHYIDPETDTLWIGFALGMRTHESQAKAAPDA